MPVTFAVKHHVSEKSSTKGKRSFYRPELDALRFGAFLAVFLHHGIYNFSPFISRFGAFGLSLFFLLSAYLITELLQREKDLTKSIDIRSFYLRRALRIWPLYYGFICLTVLLGVYFPFHRASWIYIISFILMVGNFYVGRYGFPNSSASFLWSISVEEQFYLVWPLLNVRCTRRCLFWISVAIYPVSAITVIMLMHVRATSNLNIWANPVVEFQMFAWGVLLSFFFYRRDIRITTANRLLMLALGAILWSVAARWCAIDDAHMPSLGSLLTGYPLVGAGCAAIFVAIYDMKQRRIPWIFVYLGKRSYGLYVFHELCLETAAWILNRIPLVSSTKHHAMYGILHISLGLILTSALAIASYRYYESPFLDLKDRFAIVKSRAV